ncbi:MAG: S8 family serine peptidase, partial [Chloroflexota bacterium]
MQQMRHIGVGKKGWFVPTIIALMLLLATAGASPPSENRILEGDSSQPAAAAIFGNVDPYLNQQLAKSATDLPQLIVRLDADPQSFRERIKPTAAEIVAEFELIDSVVLKNVTPELLQEIAQYPEVAYISPDLEINSSNNSYSYSREVTMETIQVSANHRWTKVNLQNSYENMVVACTPSYALSDLPTVVRLKNAENGDDFDLRVQNPSNADSTHRRVDCLVSEAGVWQLPDGSIFEATKYTSDSPNRSPLFHYQADQRTFQYPFSSPIVIGQVMTSNDNRWSSFWAHGQAYTRAVGPNHLYTGYHVGADFDDSRSPEMIGYFVFNKRSMPTEGGILYEAMSTTQAAAFSQEDIVLLSGNSMRGGDGGWPYMRIMDSAISRIWFDEDQIYDAERRHTNEHVAVLRFESNFILRNGENPDQESVANIPLAELAQGYDIREQEHNGRDQTNILRKVALDDRFDRFTADAVSDLADDCESVEFSIHLDGELAFVSPEITQNGQVVKIDLNLTDYSRMLLKTIYHGEMEDCNPGDRSGGFQNGFLELPHMSASTNYIINGSFASGRRGWDIHTDMREYRLLRDRGDQNGYAMRLGDFDDYSQKGHISQIIPVDAGKTYVLDALVLADPEISDQGFIKVDFLSEDGGNLNYLYEIKTILHEQPDYFVPQRMVFTPRENVTLARISFQNLNSPIIVDGVNLSVFEYDEAAENPNDHLMLMGADQLHADGLTGEGIGIAVVDTGVREGMIGKPLYLSVDFINQDFEPQLDEHGHGTLMSSMAAGANPGAVAPEADIISVRVLDENGSGSVSDLVEGLSFIYTYRDILNIRVVNLSIQGPVTGPYWENPINQMVQTLWDAGIVVVVAAGNTGPDAGSITTPGNDPFVITVGSYTDNYTPYDFSDDFIPPFSASGPTEAGFVKPDFIVPGAHIRAFVHTDSYFAETYPSLHRGNGLYRTAGTSSAAAVTSGAVALLLENDPSLTPNEVKYRMLAAARPALTANNQLAFSIFEQGAGMLWLPDALLSEHDNKTANRGMIPGEDYVGPAVFDETNQGYTLLGPDLTPLSNESMLFWDGQNQWDGESQRASGRFWSGTDFWAGGRVWGGAEVWSGGRGGWGGGV